MKCFYWKFTKNMIEFPFPLMKYELVRELSFIDCVLPIPWIPLSQVIPLQGRPYLDADDSTDNAVCGLLNVHFVIEESTTPVVVKHPTPNGKSIDDPLYQRHCLQYN